MTPVGTPRIQNTVAELGKWAGLFHEYYWKQLPEIGLDTMQTGIIHWNNYRSTEYVADFLKPLGIWHSMGALCLGRSNRLLGWLVLHSSKSGPKFSERDKFILEIIQPHLSNLYTVYLKFAASNQSFSDANSLKAEYRCLSKREAEVAALLCKGLRLDIIGSMLMISPRTVSTHIENIYEKLKVSSKQELLVKLLGKEFRVEK